VALGDLRDAYFFQKMKSKERALAPRQLAERRFQSAGELAAITLNDVRALGVARGRARVPSGVGGGHRKAMEISGQTRSGNPDPLSKGTPPGVGGDAWRPPSVTHECSHTQALGDLFPITGSSARTRRYGLGDVAGVESSDCFAVAGRAPAGEVEIGHMEGLERISNRLVGRNASGKILDELLDLDLQIGPSGAARVDEPFENGLKLAMRELSGADAGQARSEGDSQMRR